MSLGPFKIIVTSPLSSPLAGKVNTADLAPVALSGDYADLDGKPTLGTASAQPASAFATAAQGTKADTAVQPADLAGQPISNVTGLQTALDGKQPLNAKLTAIAALTLAANKLIYATGVGSFATSDLTALARTFLAGATPANMQATLQLVPGTNIQAYDATLAAIASLTLGANQIIYGTGTDTAATTILSAAARALLDDPDSATMRATLGMVIGTDVQAYDATLAALAAVSVTANKLIYANGADSFATIDFPTYARTLAASASAAAARATLQLVPGTDVQAYNVRLTQIAALGAANNDIIQQKGGAWVNRTMVQLKADLALTKADVGLGNVDNTSDANKPISTATAAAFDGVTTALAGKATTAQGAKADTALQPGASIDDIVDSASYKRMTAAERAKLFGIASNAEANAVDSVAGKTGIVTLVKGDVGLSSVDNTSDASKPVSTATAAALATKATAAQGANADTAVQPNDPVSDLTETSTAKIMTGAERTKLSGIAAGAQVNTVTSVAGRTGDVVLTKADSGLGNVDNTSDAGKPVSTATATALGLKANATDLAALDVRVDAVEVVAESSNGLIAQQDSRPGDARSLFTSTLTGSAVSRPVITAGSVANRSDLGAVLRVTGPDVPPTPGYLDVARRAAFAFESGRTYFVFAIFERNVDPSDPENHAIELRLQNLNGNKAAVSNVRLGPVFSPLVADGIIGRTATGVFIGKTGAPGTLDYIIPSTSIYGTPLLRIYGNGHETDVADISILDVTDFILAQDESDADIGALRADLDAEIARAIAAETSLQSDIDDIREIFVTTPPNDALYLVDGNGIVGFAFEDRNNGDGPRLYNTHYNYVAAGGNLANYFQPEDNALLIVDGNGIAGATFEDRNDGDGPRWHNYHYDAMSDAIDEVSNSVQGSDIAEFVDGNDVVSAQVEEGVLRSVANNIIISRSQEAYARSRIEQRDPALRKWALLAGLAHILYYGQSLSIDTSSNPVYRDNPVHPSILMFKGLRSREGDLDATWRNTLYPLQDKAFSDGSIYYGGGITSGAMDMLVNLLVSEDDLDIADYPQNILVSAPGEGAKSVAELSEGSTYFNRLKLDIDGGFARGTDLSLPYLLQAMVWIQGERDTDISTAPSVYKAAVLELLSDVRAYHASVTGATFDFPMFTTQLANFRAYSKGPEIAEALLELTQENDDIFLTTPLYPFVTVADQKHLTGLSSNLAGAYNGIALKRLLMDGVQPPVLKVQDTLWMPNRVVIHMDPPSGRLAQDTVAISDPGSLGFGLLDHTGAPVAITAAEVLPSNLVRLDYSGATLQTGAKWTYAYGNSGMTTTGPVNGPRGCIRDTQGDNITAFGRPLHNWLPIQHKTR